MAAKIEDDYADLFGAWQQQPSVATADPLLHALKPVLSSAVRQYGGGKASPSLLSRARLITIDALPKYDPAQGKLKSFLMSHLQGLQRLHHKQQVVLAIPERHRLESQHVNRQSDELEDMLGRPPTDEELADHTHIPFKRLAQLRGLQMGVAESSLGGDNNTEEGAPQPMVDDPLGRRHKAMVDFFYHSLTHPTDKMVLQHRLGLHGKPTLGVSEIAKVLQVTPAAVSLRAKKLQERLSALLEGGAL